MSVKGVDLSYCQAGINYNTLKAAGVKFAIIRAGISESTDKLLETHVKGCIAAGIDYGFYWYSYAKTTAAAKKEATACIKAISKFAAPKYPVFFDAEENFLANATNKTTMTDIALTFVNAVQEGGYPCGIYANPNWMENEYDKSRLTNGKVDIWLAHWTNSANKPSNYKYGQTMWQWGVEKYGGIATDADICFIDYPAKTAEWYGRGETKTVDELAIEVLNGLWGNGAERKEKLTKAGYNYSEVQAAVNKLLSNKKVKTVAEIAVEVIRGLWGNGEDRKERLAAAGYDYGKVQAEVNKLLK